MPSKLDFLFRFIGALFVALLTYLIATLPEADYPNIRWISACIVATFFYFYDPLSGFINSVRQKKSKRREIRKLLSPILGYLIHDMKLDLNTPRLLSLIEISEIDYSRKDSIIVFVVNTIHHIPQTQKDAIILAAICREIDNEPDFLVAGLYKTVVSAIFEKYDFISLDEDAKSVIRHYEKYHSGKDVGDEIDFRSRTEEITRKYNKTYNLSFRLKLERDQIEEFRRTLSILIRDGRLDVQELEKTLKDKVRVELDRRATKSKAFLVLSQKFHKIPAVDQALSRFPFVKYSYPNPSRLPDNLRYVATRIIYPSSTIQDAKSFLENEIRPLIPEDKVNDGFIALIPIVGTELYSTPQTSEALAKVRIRNGFESISAYRTGIPINMEELYLESLKDEINVDEVLANIPMNIFVPSIPERAKNFLIDCYDDLREHFSIRRLADWASVNPGDLRDRLTALDSGTDKKRVYSEENWGAVADSIVNAAIKHRNAMGV